MSSDGALVQSNHYYPYGMSFTEGTQTSTQPFKFGNKELDTQKGLNWYDSQARMQDPVIPGFPTMDPLAEDYYSWSPYGYCKSNPMNRIDPDGKDDYFTNKGVFVMTGPFTKTDVIKIVTRRENGSFRITPITETSLSSSAIEKVVGHYNAQLDASDGAMPEVKIEAAPAVTNKGEYNSNVLMQVSNLKPNTIRVNKNTSGLINKWLKTVGNMKSTLVNERTHVKQNKERGIMSGPNEAESKSRELEAIDNQKNHSSWSKTTEKFKKATEKYEEDNK